MNGKKICIGMGDQLNPHPSHATPFPLHTQNTQTTHSPCIQTSEGHRPGAATREHPNTHSESLERHRTTFTIVHSRLSTESKNRAEEV